MKEKLFSVMDCVYGLEYLDSLGYAEEEDKTKLREMFERMDYLKSQGMKNFADNFKRKKILNDTTKRVANIMLQESYDRYAVGEANKGKGNTVLDIEDIPLVGYMEHFKKKDEKTANNNVNPSNSSELEDVSKDNDEGKEIND